MARPRPLLYTTLTPEEIKLKRMVQEILSENGVLNSMTDREWNTYCSRKVLREFSKLMVKRFKDMKKANPREAPRKSRAQ